MANVSYDESGWPIVMVTMPPYELTTNDFRSFLDHLTAYHERGQRFGLCFDIGGAPAPDAERRRLMAERVDADIRRYGRVCPSAIVTKSALQRAALKTMTRLVRTPYPMAAFATKERAVEWLKTTLGAKESAPRARRA